GISRFKVARLLDSAVAAGLVRIRIGLPGALDITLSVELQARFGLRHCVVIDSHESAPAEMRRVLAGAAARLLTEIVTPEDVLGLAWARSAADMVGQLRGLAPVPVVQLTGALSSPDLGDTSIELVREVAHRTGGPAYYFYAPLIVPDTATSRALRKQPEIARAFAQVGAVTKAVVGLGAWAPGQSTLFDAMGAFEREELVRLGVIGEICSSFIDREGHAIVSSISERMIGIDAAGLASVPEVIAIPYGDAKASAVRAAVNGGFVNGLVTHSSLARILLGDDDLGDDDLGDNDLGDNDLGDHDR
ncbi:MAG TPA: sugar-binding domain-containing protein, partial [Candidatus Lustribacter sp.]|nr:sugar-binding domain-containing protein [Candidatus Lustribacter sp.]